MKFSLRMAWLCIGLLFLSSFALVPTPPVKKTAPPTKTQRVKKRLQQRLLHLEQRLQRAQHPQQKLRLQKRIHRIQEGPSKNWAWAIVGFSISSLAFILFLILFLGGINSLSGVIFAFLVLIILGILGIIFSIVGIVMPSIYEKFGGRGLAIAGLALAGGILLFFLIALIVRTL